MVAAVTRAPGGPGDLGRVHSLLWGVLGMRGYANGDMVVVWGVCQPGQRRVPADVEALTEGRAKVTVVRIHEVGEPAPEESWLRVHARLVDESRREAARLSTFRPRSGERFVWRAGGR